MFHPLKITYNRLEEHKMIHLTFSVYKGSNNMKTVDWSSPWRFCFAVQQSEHPCGAPRSHFHSAINLYVLLQSSPGTQHSTRLWASSRLRNVYWTSILNVINPKLSVYSCVLLLLPSFFIFFPRVHRGSWVGVCLSVTIKVWSSSASVITPWAQGSFWVSDASVMGANSG